MRSQIHHLVAEAAITRADTPALTFQDVTVSYAQFWREVGSFGAALSGLGLGRGDRVAVYAEKRIETAIALFGASAAGGVFVPVNPLLRPKQVGYLVRDCDARILVTTPERFALLREELDECKSVGQVVLVGSGPAPADETARRYGVSRWTGGEDAPVTATAAGVIDTDMAAILYTSGSTGQAQGGRAQSPQSHCRGGKREPLSGQHR